MKRTGIEKCGLTTSSLFAFATSITQPSHIHDPSSGKCLVPGPTGSVLTRLYPLPTSSSRVDRKGSSGSKVCKGLLAERVGLVVFILRTGESEESEDGFCCCLYDQEKFAVG